MVKQVNQPWRDYTKRNSIVVNLNHKRTDLTLNPSQTTKASNTNQKEAAVNFSMDQHSKIEKNPKLMLSVDPKINSLNTHILGDLTKDNLKRLDLS